jgi:hypothetical protein
MDAIPGRKYELSITRTDARGVEKNREGETRDE